MAHQAIVTPQFSEYLRKGRADFNALYAKFAVLNKGMNAADFTENLRLLTHSLEKNKHCQQITYEIFSAYFKIALDLTARRLLASGDVFAGFRKNISDIIALLPWYLVSKPEENLIRLLSALKSVHQTRYADMQRWITLLAHLGSGTENAEEFYKAAFVSAWRCGAAIYRESALETLETISDALAAIIFDTSGKSSAEIAQFLRSNPMQVAESLSTNVHKPVLIRKFIGGFSGFGGEFVTPPTIVKADDSVYLTDDRKTYRLYADGYGHALAEANDTEAHSTAAKPAFKNSGNFVAASATTEYFITELAYSAKLISTSNFAVIGFANSHKLLLIYERLSP